MERISRPRKMITRSPPRSEPRPPPPPPEPHPHTRGSRSSKARQRDRTRQPTLTRAGEGVHEHDQHGHKAHDQLRQNKPEVEIGVKDLKCNTEVHLVIK